MKTCENIPLVHALHDEALPDEQAQQLRQHMAGCDACTAELQSLERVSNLFASASLPEMTPWMLAQVHQQLDKRMNAKAESAVMRLAQWLSAAAATILVVSSLQLALMQQRTAQADTAPTLAWEMSTAMLAQDVAGSGGILTDDHSLAAWVVDDLASATVSSTTQAGE